MFKLPHKLPASYVTLPGAITSTPVDTGGYDVMVGGLGFRLASDATNPYQRQSVQLSSTRPDQSAENAEQTLTDLPWVKAQSTFHGGAGQISFESTSSDVPTSHLRFDNSYNCDVWTPGKVVRLPDVSAAAVTSVAFGTTTPNIVGAITVPAVQAIIGVPAVTDVSIALGADGSLYQVQWAGGVMFSSAKLPSATLTAPVKGVGIATDGRNFYALVTSDSNVSPKFNILSLDSMLNASVPDVGYTSSAINISPQGAGAIGWVKARLMVGAGRGLYEIPVPSPAPGTTFPAAKYTDPSVSVAWTAFSESPDGVLASNTNGLISSVIELTLDTSGTLPVLSGGESVVTLPPGETIYSMLSYVGSFLTLGTASGIRYGTYDTYTGKLKISPLILTTAAPVKGLVGRSRFIYGGFSRGNEDGTSGLARCDLSLQVDQQGHVAYAPDIVLPAVTDDVVGINMLPSSQRLLVLTPNGFYSEGAGPGTTTAAWLRTSRIRYGTSEPKLFKLGRISGALSTSQITVAALLPYQAAYNCGTFGFTTVDPGEFRIADGSGTWEWVQMRFTLLGAACELDSYQVKGYPQPARGRMIEFTCDDFVSESDRYGLEADDPVDPRSRLLALEALERAGGEQQFVEFTNSGAVTYRTIIEQISYSAANRPSIDDDFGGLITIRLRTTE